MFHSKSWKNWKREGSVFISSLCELIVQGILWIGIPHACRRLKEGERPHLVDHHHHHQPWLSECHI